ncbi:MAG: DUF401 family protein, partial [Spirochaetota bacterium]
MNFVLSIPYLLRILISLSLILSLNKITKNLFIALLAGTVLLAFWSGHSVQTVVLISWNRATSADNLFLLLIIFLVIWFSTQMSETGTMKALVKYFRARFSKRASMAILPAVIGLLPMPGGALFSAPLVADCDTENGVSSNLKTRINYWFRHIWEYWWPLYPGVLLAVDISGLPIWQFMVILFPMTLFSVLGGYLFIIRKIHPISSSIEKEMTS